MQRHIHIGAIAWRGSLGLNRIPLGLQRYVASAMQSEHVTVPAEEGVDGPLSHYL